MNNINFKKLQTGHIPTLAQSITLIESSLEAALFFLILNINLLNSNKISNNNKIKDSIPKKRKIHTVPGLLYAVLCIE